MTPPGPLARLVSTLHPHVGLSGGEGIDLLRQRQGRRQVADGTSASGSHTVNVMDGRPTPRCSQAVGVTPRLTAVDVMLGAGVDTERAGGRITWQPDAMKTKDANKSMIVEACGTENLAGCLRL